MSGNDARLLEEFESRWQAGAQPPDAFEFLKQHAESDAESQLGVLLSDQHHRWQSGLARPVEEYLANCPPVARSANLKVRLILGEVSERKERGDVVRIESLAARFPDCAQLLRRFLDQAPRSDQAQAEQPPTLAAAPRTGHPTPVIQASSSHETAVFTPSHSTQLPRPTGGVTVQFGDYLIEGEIARGGMGIVYRAFDKRLDRVVALKCIREGALASSKVIQRFRAEALAAARLEHPNIVPIYDVGEHQGSHYFAMGYVQGETLAAKINRGPISPPAAAALVETIARAVDYAHQQGVVHRDLKPGNILLDAAGQPHVTDFGLAKRLQEDTNVTVTGEIMGTPSYMSPEQATGQTGNVQPAIDIYALGAILYCLLTGRPPFQAASVSETMQQVLESEPVGLRSLNSAVPKDLETICLKCLQKSPAHRYATAGEVAADLRRFMNGETIIARPTTYWERCWRWCRRNPVVATLTALVVMISVVGTAATTALAIHASAKANEASRNFEKASAATARVRAEKDRTQQVLYHHQIQQAYSEWQLGNIRRFRELLDSCPEEFRGWEFSFLSRLPGSAHRKLDGHTNLVHCLAVNNDGTLLVSGGRDRRVILWDLATGKQIDVLRDHRSAVTCAAFVPQSDEVVTGSTDQTIRIGSIPGAARKTLRGHTSAVTGLVVSKDGKLLVSASADGAVKVWNLQHGRVLRDLQVSGTTINSLTISPDGKLVVGGGNDSRVYLWDLETGRELAKLAGHARQINAVTFDPAGARFVTGSDDTTLIVWDAKSLTPVLTLRGHTLGVTAVRFTGEPDRIASGSWDSLLIEWNAATGEIVRTRRGHSGRVSGVAASSTLRNVISCGEDSSIRVWDADTDQESITCRGHEGWVTSLAFDPSGRFVASGGVDNTVRIWDAESGRELKRLTGHTGQISDLAFTRNGRLVSAGGDGKVKVWNLETGAVTAELTGHEQGLTCLAVSASGRLLATGSSDQTVRLWDLDRDQQIAVWTGHSGTVYSVAISPDEKLVASAGADSTARVWDIERGTVVATLLGHTKAVRCIAFDPSGQRIVTASDDNVVRICNAQTGRLQKELKGHVLGVRSAEFSPDASRIVSGGIDRQLMLWDAVTGDEVLTLRGHLENVLRAHFSPNGRCLASCSTDGTLRLWDAPKASRDESSTFD